MLYCFDDLHIGTTEAGKRGLVNRLISRPAGLTNGAWYKFAAEVCELLDRPNVLEST